MDKYKWVERDFIIDLVTIKITKVIELGRQEIPNYTYDYVWNSDKHKEAMNGEPPEFDPMELYGKYIKTESAPRIIENSYTVEAECKDAIVGDVLYLGVSNMVCVKNGKLITQEPFIKGNPHFKVGQEVEPVLVYRAEPE